MPTKNNLLVERLERRLGYNFQDSALLSRALTHRSVGSNNNERQEFLGDSILGFVIAEALFQQFSKTPEGQLSRMRSQLVKGQTLAEIAREFELGDCLNLGEGELKSGGFRRDSILADAVEAIIGAIYLDSDLDTCRNCILSWFGARLEKIEPEMVTKDNKTRLQEYLQGRGLALPEYDVVETKGPLHDQTFVVQCKVSPLNSPIVGEGSNRRKAEQEAAALVLAELQ